MNLLEKATEFLKCFCDEDLDGLNILLAEDFRFKGPFIECTSKESYIGSLKEDPPKGCQIEVIRAFEDGEEVAIFYIFTKQNIRTSMAQFFRFNEGKIIETLLIFDSQAFAKTM